MTITLTDKPVNPVTLGGWDTIATKVSRNVPLTDAVRDKKAIRDYKGNIIGYADTQDTSIDFDWEGGGVTTAPPAGGTVAPPAGGTVAPVVDAVLARLRADPTIGDAKKAGEAAYAPGVWTDAEGQPFRWDGTTWQHAPVPPVAGTAAVPLVMPYEAGFTHNMPTNPDGSAHVDVSNLYKPKLGTFEISDIVPPEGAVLISLDILTGVVTIIPGAHKAITFIITDNMGVGTAHNFGVSVPAVP